MYSERPAPPSTMTNSPPRYTLPPIASSPTHPPALPPTRLFSPPRHSDQEGAPEGRQDPRQLAFQTAFQTSSFPTAPSFSYQRPTYHSHPYESEYDRSPPPWNANYNARHPYEDIHYYPVYNEGREEGDWSDEDMMRSLENSRSKRLREYDDRLQEIDREFMESRESVYREKIKQLQEELVAIQSGGHVGFDDCVTSLSETRLQVIESARLIMSYEIASVDLQYDVDSRSIEEESLAEKRSLQNEMYAMLEEKRRRLKEDKDDESSQSNDLMLSSHQTRNRRRMLRKRGEPVPSDTTLSKKRSLNGPLTKRRQLPDRTASPHHSFKTSEEDLEEDLFSIRKSIAAIKKHTMLSSMYTDSTPNSRTSSKR